MDLSGYIKKGRRDDVPKDKKCMNCGNLLESDGKDLYSRRFCSEKCRDEYMQ